MRIMLEVVFASPQFVGAELSGFIEVIVRITGGSSIIMDDPVVSKKIKNKLKINHQKRN